MLYFILQLDLLSLAHFIFNRLTLLLNFAPQTMQLLSQALFMAHRFGETLRRVEHREHPNLGLGEDA
jgi:hypothetical protein